MEDKEKPVEREKEQRQSSETSSDDDDSTYYELRYNLRTGNRESVIPTCEPTCVSKRNPAPVESSQTVSFGKSVKERGLTHAEKTPVKSTREQRETEQKQCDEQNVDPDNSVEEEENVSDAESEVIQEPGTGSESETVQPVPEETAAGPGLAPQSDEQTFRRSTRDRRPAALFTYNSLGQPSLQAQPSVSSAEVYETPHMTFWGMQPYPPTPYTVQMAHCISVPYLSPPYNAYSGFYNMPIYTY